MLSKNFYRAYGFDEIFEVFANVNQPLNHHYYMSNKFDDVLLYLVIYPYRQMPFIKPRLTLNSKKTKLYKHFSREVTYEKQHYYKYSFSVQYWRCPKLSELSRDSIRLTIANSQMTKKETGPFDYVNAVRTLDLPRKIQDVLIFKETLYEDCD